MTQLRRVTGWLAHEEFINEHKNKKMEVLRIAKPKGSLAEIIGDHPHSGKTAEYVGNRSTHFGLHPVFADSDGVEFFVFDKKNIKWRK